MSEYKDLIKLGSRRNCLQRIACHDERQFSKDSFVSVMENFLKAVNIMDDTILVPRRLMDSQVGDSSDIVPPPGKDSTANQLKLNSTAHGKRSVDNSKDLYEFLHSTNLFSLFNMLNALKNELLWTGKDEEVAAEEENSNSLYLQAEAMTDCNNTELNTTSPTANVTATATTTTAPTTTPASVKSHVRHPSTGSVASTVSGSNMNDSDSDMSNENDSGVESEGNKSHNIQSSADSISSSEDVCTQMKANNMEKATELAKRCKRHLNGLYQCLEQMTEVANYLTARYQSDLKPL